MRAATGGHGVDVIVDFGGGDYLARNLRDLAPFRSACCAGRTAPASRFALYAPFGRKTPHVSTGG
ncbi:hypothetical protein ACO2RV_00495 [Ancylobacter sp. VNQ12]|uniref:hypothetical protein n=1 Tax=Ancylobacter sp. VNQ12 TaxID=3400920 RepID=UPI003C07179B